MRFNKTLNTKVLSILVSVLLSFFLWLVLAGQDTSSTELTVPLELANLPGDLAIKTDLPTAINFQVMANPAQLRFIADRKLRVFINASSAREGYNAFSIEPETLELPRGVQVRKITPPVVEFETVKTANKVVPLKPVTQGTVNPFYRVKALIIEPDEVTIQGPQEFLADIKELPTTPIQLDDLTADITVTVTPSLADAPGLTVNPREIKAILKVEERRLEETFVDLPVLVETRGESRFGVSHAPERVEISVSWPATRPRAVTPDDITAKITVDLERLGTEGRQSLPVVVIPPAGVTITGINPPNVTVTRGAPISGVGITPDQSKSNKAEQAAPPVN
ncbi:hypothetical protein LJB99_04415 [Deltaproteobacteria bacterium OttesenSCG-928-K17]|nr:hypothetical protein [Deltaproteobacteria bacterium OttesenSCG-928-K17]